MGGQPRKYAHYITVNIQQWAIKHNYTCVQSTLVQNTGACKSIYTVYECILYCSNVWGIRYQRY